MTENKILLVTGASSEIGIGILKEISGRYDRVIAHYYSCADTLMELNELYGGKLIPIQADFSDMESTCRFVSEIKRINIFPNHVIHLAAPKAGNLQFHKYLWDDYLCAVNTSLRSIIILLENLIPKMRKDRYGRIIFMLTSYILGGVPPKYQSPYLTVKYGLYGLMRGLACEYADRGITVNGVSPDMMETKFLSGIEPMIIRQNAEKNPLGRNIEVNDVIPVIQYLLSDEAAAITGQNIGITGGIR